MSFAQVASDTQGSPTISPNSQKTDGSQLSVPLASVDMTRKNKKFLNGWTRELEELFAEWSDKSACYQWLHEQTERRFSTYNQAMMIPVIILSTLTGTANFGLTSIVGPDEELQKYAQIGIGAVSLFVGILTTLANFLRYAQGSESHRVAAISWGKFQRYMAVELQLHPNERMDSMQFLKICRAELDRLIEQSPAIPNSVINSFKRQFKHLTQIRKPEIVHEIQHTHIFNDSESRLKKMAVDAAILLNQKKGVIKDLVLADIDTKVTRIARQMAADEARIVVEEIINKRSVTTQFRSAFNGASMISPVQQIMTRRVDTMPFKTGFQVPLSSSQSIIRSTVETNSSPNQQNPQTTPAMNVIEMNTVPVAPDTVVINIDNPMLRGRRGPQDGPLPDQIATETPTNTDNAS